MSMTFPPDVRGQLLSQLTASLEQRSIADLRRMAQLWRWPVKGPSKAGIVQAVAANLSDPSIMQRSFAELPAQEQLALTLLTVIAIRGKVSDIVVRILSAATSAAVSESDASSHFEDLLARGLIYFDHSRGYVVPGIYREWLPGIAPAGLQLSTAQRLEPRPTFSAAMLSSRVEDLLYAIGVDRPALRTPPIQARSTEVVPRGGPFGAEVLAQWGYDAEDEKNLARFLLMALLHGKLIEVAIERSGAVLQVNTANLANWSSLAPMEQQASLTRFWQVQSAQTAALALPHNSRWNEIDLAVEQLRREGSPHRLVQAGYADAVDYAIEGLALQLRAALASIVDLLARDTWYSFDGLCELVRCILPDPFYLPSLGRMLQWAERSEKRTEVALDQQTWRATNGALLAAWLAGPAAWLGLVQLAYDGQRLVAFRRPNALQPSQAARLPGDAVRFLREGQLALRTYWQAADLRSLVRQIAALEARDHRQLTFRLDPGVFRTALERGATAGQVIEDFARFGFPLPQEVQKRLRSWEDRAGRFQLYEDLAAVEFGDSLALREVQAAVDIGKLEAYPASPQCLVILNPTAVPSMVEDLRRRGYLPKVIS